MSVFKAEDAWLHSLAPSVESFVGCARPGVAAEREQRTCVGGARAATVKCEPVDRHSPGAEQRPGLRNNRAGHTIFVEMDRSGSNYQGLAAYRRCRDRIEATWAQFLELRADRLRHGGESEKVAEGILEDLFTNVLDWTKGDLNYQVGFADIVISRNLAKYLVIEVKRPGTLYPGRRALENALDQARRYATEQRIARIAAGDGRYLYAADMEGGGLKPRALVDLAKSDASPSLWWLSVHGVYRPCEEAVAWPAADEVSLQSDQSVSGAELLLHPKYGLPASCFAYVGDPNHPATWKLPYLLFDGHPDERRLPKAIQALLGNYRGAKVGGIPEQAIIDVLTRLARAAASMGKLPPCDVNPAPAYQQLAAVLDQLGIPRP